MANYPSGAAPAWPTTLPVSPQLSNFQITYPDLVIRTQMEVGPDKVRRRISNNVQPMRMRVTLNATQLAAFRTFFMVTCQGGALQFEWRANLQNPGDMTAGKFRFRSPPIAAPRGGGWWEVSLDLELMP